LIILTKKDKIKQNCAAQQGEIINR